MIYLFSLKAATRVRWQGSKAPVYYHITDTTHIAKVPVKRLLSHTKTKMELAICLGKKIKEYAHRSGKQLVVAWGSVCKATHKDVGHLQSNQEEAKLTQRWSYRPLMLLLMAQLNYRFTLRTQMSPSLLLDVSGIVWEHAVCHGKRATPSYYWAETNCWNSWPREDSSTSSIPRPKLSWQHRKFFRKGKASLLEDICRSGFINYHCPCRTWTSCSSKWRNCRSHWEVCLSAISTKNKTYDC